MNNKGTKLYTLWEKRRKRQRLIVIFCVLLVGLFILLRPTIFHGSSSTTSSTNSASSQSENSVTRANPDFAALTASGKSVDWSKLSPPNSDNFYVYTDTISGVAIRISEQKVPDNLKDDANLAELAKNYNANRSITVDGTTIYLGTSAKEQQSIIFVKRSLLILITSNDVLNDHQWTEYISSMQ